MTLSNAPFNLGILGFAYASAGEKEKAEKALDELARLAKERYVSPYYFSVIWAGLADADKTFHYLERAYEERESFLAVLRRWPFFDGFGDDPRLLSIEKKIGLPS
jgi:tetratricopeptide (TPR) repeat protein